MSLIKLTHVSAHYDVCILQDINLIIEPNSFTSITGDSGTGKSTLLNIIGLLAPPCKGQVFISHTNTQLLCNRKLANMRNQTFGYIFQKPHLISHLSLYENIILPTTYTPYTDNFKDYAMQLIEICQLEQHLKTPVTYLSLGQQQRVSIARALILKPEIIIADEPTGALDPNNTHRIMRLLREMNPTCAIIMSTHSHQLIAKSDQHYQIHNKKLVSV
ncbi:ATP-binding cassette domain-containing protein [Candidatus Comchoanobacter bicostacola]|uniref:ATP-binding cassette domain-containing protein n=1 Tax=Candidatus Comchoanobacter bicostacola TaxID=2919598 RepID=A0ABY5DM49_9GAMM|nr:ATP-binding cassette domain-containing protein [Candidatus Comchoanobacter bicostacola]UTC24834.1 ATP-binding cassette domain-containing protein [Candidatus Comchoanobacter bicostacola]